MSRNHRAQRKSDTTAHTISACNSTCWNVLALMLVFSTALFLFLSKGMPERIDESPSGLEGTIHPDGAATDLHHHATQGHGGGQLYSLFMHHTAGYVVLTIGILMLLDRETRSRYRLLTYAIGATWILFSLFLFIRANPDGWPIGSGLWESWIGPTGDEWLQHKLLSVIPLILGLYTLSHRPTSGHDNRLTYLTAGIGILGVAGLLSHQHLDHSGMDIVNIQHQWFAGTAFFITLSLVGEAKGRWLHNRKRLILPGLLILLALQLIWYVE